MNAESERVLKNTDYKQAAKDAGEYTRMSAKKIIVGQVVYYVLPPMVFETRISNIQAVFVQENEIYLEESNHLKQQSEREADEYMDELHEQIGKIEASLTDFSPFEGDACIELDRLNEIYQMGIDFKQEWLDFCQCNFVAGGN